MDAIGLNEQIEIRPAGPIDARVRPPGSKSITNRALVCAALARGSSTLVGALDSEDTRIMAQALRQLGVRLDADWPAGCIAVRGCDGTIPAEQAELFVGNSGTTVRFLTPVVALGNGRFRLDGVPRMRQRPVADLLDALRQLGVDAVSEAGTGSPPVVVHAAGIEGGRAAVRGDTSSQFLSGLLMAAPYAQCPVELVVDGPLVSRPYVEMTQSVMHTFGVDVTRSGAALSVAAPQAYRACRFEIEPDASAASYFFAAAAITGGRIVVQGLTRRSIQGDIRFCDVLAQMGCDVTETADGIAVAAGPLHGTHVDMNDISDTVPTLAAVALFAQGETTITGVAHIRHKETDRIGDLATELRRLGATVAELPDGLRITPSEIRRADIETYDDHRMAMSMALVGLAAPAGVVIKNPGCTAKTYPGFFDDLARIHRAT